MNVTGRAYIEGRRDVDFARRTAARVFEKVDVIVTPTTATPPALLTDVAKDVTTSMAISLRTIRNTSPFNLYGRPTISVPCGFTRSGLPIGLQISGAPADEGVVLRIAHAYEQITDWHTRRPPTA